MLNKLKFIIGGALFVLSLIIPLFGIWVAQLPIPVAIKTVIIGLLTFGAPELLAISAVAILGKPAFEWMMNRVFATLHKLAPRGTVGRTRYKIGLFLFVVSFVPSYVLSYFPTLVPESPPWRIIACLCADVVLIVSLFILGGDFWDKLRALFIYDSAAVFPKKSEESA